MWNEANADGVPAVQNRSDYERGKKGEEGMTTKERPILFSGAMVRAILEGRKTQTRRLIDPQPTGDSIRCPFGDFGDRLYVRETFGRTAEGIVYRATDPDWETTEDWKWTPSIHMPRVASRIALDIVSVRVERLNDISEADAMAEGVSDVKSKDGRFAYGDIEAYFNYPIYQRKDPECYLAKWSFKHLWESINGVGSWAANSWVWVVEFRKVEN